jgi:hypothetical protein
VYLTSVGRDALERVRAVQRAEILAAIADWSPEEQQTFAELMSRFASRFVAWAVDDFSATSPGPAASFRSGDSRLRAR